MSRKFERHREAFKGVETNAFILPNATGLLNGRKDRYANEGMSDAGMRKMGEAYSEMHRHFFPEHNSDDTDCEH